MPRFGMQVSKELSKLGKMLSDGLLLGITLLENALLSHKLYILLGDFNLTIALADLVQHLGCKLELCGCID